MKKVKQWLSAVMTVAIMAGSASPALAAGEPEPPINFVSTGNKCDNCATMSWSGPPAGPNPDGYYVYRDGVRVAALPANQTTYLDNGLTNGVMYQYQVSAFNGTGEGPRSVFDTATPDGRPGTPQSFVSTGNGCDQCAILQWEAPTTGEPPDGYYIYRNDVLVATVPAPGLTYKDTGLTNGVMYEYLVSAYNVYGEGPRTYVDTAVPTTAPGPLASFVSTGNGCSGCATLNWDAPTTGGTPSGYNIYRNNVKIASVPAAARFYLDSGLPDDIVYDFHVAAFNDAGEGPKTYDTGRPHIIVGMAAVPTDVKAVHRSGQTVITWSVGTPVPDAVAIYRNGQRLGTATGNTFTDVVGPTDDLTVPYTVVAENSYGKAAATPIQAEGQLGDVQAPLIFGLSTDAPLFKMSTTIKATFSEVATWTMKVNAADGTTVKTFTGKGDSISQSITATDLSDGVYTVEVQATDDAGNQSSVTQTTIHKISSGTFLTVTTKPYFTASNTTMNLMATTFRATFNRKVQAKVIIKDDVGAIQWTSALGAANKSGSINYDGWATPAGGGPRLPLPNGSYLYTISVLDPLTGVEELSPAFRVRKTDATPVIKTFQASATYFRTSARITSTFSKESSYTVTFYRASDGKVVDQVTDKGAALDLTWTPPEAGAYKYTLRLVDEAGQKAQRAGTTLTLDKALTLSPLTMDRSVLSPGKTRITLIGTANERVKSSLAIKNGSGTVVRTVTANYSPSVRLTIDGRDNTGVSLSNGEYTYELTVTDLAGNSVTRNGSFSVDAAMPVLTVTAPGSAVTEAAEITLPFQVTDNRSGNITITRQGSSGMTVIADNLTFSDTTVTVPLESGLQTITFTVMDEGGNKLTRKLKLIRVTGAELRLYVGTALLTSATKPINSNTVFVPVNVLAPKLGVSVAATPGGKITLASRDGAKTVLLEVGGTTITTNGSSAVLTAAPYLNGKTVMVPAVAVAESFGYRADWLDQVQTLSIYQ